MGPSSTFAFWPFDFAAMALSQNWLLLCGSCRAWFGLYTTGKVREKEPNLCRMRCVAWWIRQKSVAGLVVVGPETWGETVINEEQEEMGKWQSETNNNGIHLCSWDDVRTLCPLISWLWKKKYFVLFLLDFVKQYKLCGLSFQSMWDLFHCFKLTHSGKNFFGVTKTNQFECTQRVGLNF